MMASRRVAVIGRHVGASVDWARSRSCRPRSFPRPAVDADRNAARCARARAHADRPHARSRARLALRGSARCLAGLCFAALCVGSARGSRSSPGIPSKRRSAAYFLPPAAHGGDGRPVRAALVFVHRRASRGTSPHERYARRLALLGAAGAGHPHRRRDGLVGLVGLTLLHRTGARAHQIRWSSVRDADALRTGHAAAVHADGAPVFRCGRQPRLLRAAAAAPRPSPRRPGASRRSRAAPVSARSMARAWRPPPTIGLVALPEMRQRGYSDRAGDRLGRGRRHAGPDDSALRRADRVRHRRRAIDRHAVHRGDHPGHHADAELFPW